MIRISLAALLAGTSMLNPSQAGAQEDSGDFFTIIPSGAAQYDIGRVNVPHRPDSVDQRTLDEFRRLRIGVSGHIGGVGHKVEFDFTDSDIVPTDVYVQREFGLLRLRVGNMKTNISFSEETSSKSGNFLERASFTDAFGFDRRTGIQARYATGDVLLWGGVFIDNLDVILTGESSLWSASGRAVWAPRLGSVQLHFGASAQHTEYDQAPVSRRYRQRPLFHATADRFVDTGVLSAANEGFYGMEVAVIAGRFYGASEHGWLDVSGGVTDALFDGGYVEAGWSVTGEAPHYSGGRFDRASVASPLSAGGPGGVVVAARYDWLDLDDWPIVGGQQRAFGGSLIWTPVDPVRLSVSYSRLMLDGSPSGAEFANGDFTTDVVGARIQLTF